MTMAREDSKLSIGIIGAGIAGLATAIALREKGHHVEVFERSQFKNEVGAAIQTTPNATRLLDRWGFNFDTAGGTINNQVRVHNGTTLELMMRESFEEVEREYGAKWWMFHRADLHDELRRLAQGPEAFATPPAFINLASEVTAVDAATGTLVLKGDKKVQKDAIIIADGFRSRFFADVTGEPEAELHTDRSAYRLLIPIEKINADKETRAFYENELPGFMIGVVLSSHKIFVTYPCRKNRLLNVAIIHPTSKERDNEEEGCLGPLRDSTIRLTLDTIAWDYPVPQREVLDYVKDFHPAFQAIVRKSEDIKLFKFIHRTPVNCWAKGKVAFLGDSVHAMQPTHAQGAAMGIEDAAALGVLLADARPTDDIEGLLRTYEEVRKPRASTIQLCSGANVVQAGPADMEEQVRRFYDGPFPDQSTPPWTRPWRDFIYSYDVRKETEKALLDYRRKTVTLG